MMAQQDRIESSIMGVPFTIKGVNMAIFTALCAIVAFVMWHLTLRVTEEHSNALAVISSEHNSISKSIEKQTIVMERQTDAIIEQNYILLADESETKELRKAFRRPESMRRKLGQ